MLGEEEPDLSPCFFVLCFLTHVILPGKQYIVSWLCSYFYNGKICQYYCWEGGQNQIRAQVAVQSILMAEVVTSFVLFGKA